MAVSAQSQFQELATTDDGSQLYFASKLRQRGTDQVAYLKLFRWKAGVLELFAQGGRYSDSEPGYYLLHDPDVSGDGTVVSYLAENPCDTTFGCALTERYQSTVFNSEGRVLMTFSGRARLSKNGRYALQFGSAAPPLKGNLVDLTSGERTPIPGRILQAGRQSLANDGTVVIADEGGLALWNSAGIRDLISERNLGAAVISPEGTVVVYVVLRLDADSHSWLPSNLRSIDLISGRETILETRPTDRYLPSISNDGRVVLFLAPPAPSMAKQVFMIRPDGIGRKQLTNQVEGMVTATLSGDGKVAYAVSRAGRLLKIDLVSDSIQQLVGRTPVITDVIGSAVPGSLNWIRGTGLADGTPIMPAGDSESVVTMELQLAGTAVRPVRVSPTEIQYQIPVKLQPGAVGLQLVSSDSTFEQPPIQLTIKSFLPRFLRHGREVSVPGVSVEDLPIIAHSGFDSLVTPANPANPGEIVHFYMVGLGPVNPEVPSNNPAPSLPAAAVTIPFQCEQLEQGGRTPAEVLFAGLAPGFVGVYQVSVRLADRSIINTPWLDLACGDGEGREDQATVPIQLMP